MKLAHFRYWTEIHIRTVYQTEAIAPTVCSRPGAPGCPVYNPSTGPFTFFNPQYSSLYAWRSVGTTSYNALQVTLRHKLIHGIQFDANYTYSKSIDLASDATRVGALGGLGDQITNSWDPYQLRGDSDYDLRHQFNTNFIVDMPFGRNRAFGHDSNKALDALIGGWQLTGLFRITSGFPVNVGNVFGFPTNWDLTGLADQIAPVQTGHYAVIDGNGNPNISLFPNGANAISSFGSPLPGESGARNQIRGEGFFEGSTWAYPSVGPCPGGKAKSAVPLGGV